MLQAIRPLVESARAVRKRPHDQYGRKHAQMQPAAELRLDRLGQVLSGLLDLVRQGWRVVGGQRHDPNRTYAAVGSG